MFSCKKHTRFSLYLWPYWLSAIVALPSAADGMHAAMADNEDAQTSDAPPPAKTRRVAPKGSLTLYLVLHEDDATTSINVGFIATRDVTPNCPVIGLRQDPKQAFERYKTIFGDINPRVCFEITFTPEAVALYMTDITDEANDFMPRLHKKKYTRQNIDWGVWHFAGDLPLRRPQSITYELISL